MAEQKNPNIMLESDLPADLQTVKIEPIIPSQQQVLPAAGDSLPLYFRGSIAPTLQHDVSLVKTGINPRQANTPLMPPAPSANPQNNANITSIIRQSVSTASDIDPFMYYRGAWSASISYIINDVVTFNGSLYLAIQASANLQPDNNRDSNPAEGSSIGSPVWTLLSENFVFGASSVFTSSGYGIGAFDGQLLNRGSSSSPVLGPLTPSGSGDLAILAITERVTDLDSNWVLIASQTPASNGILLKALPTSSTVSQTLTFTAGPWSVNLALFRGMWTAALMQPSLSSVQVASNVLTVQVPNSFVVGQNVSFENVAAAAFLDNQIVTIVSANSTSFTANFTHANYGPTADTGTVLNLLYHQTASGQYTGDNINPTAHTISFPNPVKAGSVLAAFVISSDTNANGQIASVSDSQGDSWIVFNDPHFGSAASMAFCQNAKGGNTTLTVTGIGSSPSPVLYIFEFVGAPSTYRPYDVFEFKGSFFVCLKETTLDAFNDPASWGQISQGTGFIDSLSGTYTAVLTDYGRLILNKTSNNFQVNLPAVPPINSWWVVIGVEQGSGGSITLSPNGNTLDGLSGNRTLSDGQSLFIFTDGTSYFSIGGFGIGSAAGGVNSQTISYVAIASDSGKLISMNGSNLTLTLSNPVPTSRWFIAVENLNSTNLTIANNGLTIDGVSGSLTLGQNQGIVIYSDGSNYKTLHGVNSLAVPNIFTVTAPDGSGNVAISLVNQNANTGFRGPVSGAAGQPSFRGDVPADLPGYVFVSGTGVTTSQNGTLRPGGGIASAGTYRVSVYMVLTQNPSAGTLDVNIGWNDGTAARNATNGSNGMPADISTAATNFAQGQTVLEVDGVHDITWAFTLA